MNVCTIDLRISLSAERNRELVSDYPIVRIGPVPSDNLSPGGQTCYLGVASILRGEFDSTPLHGSEETGDKLQEWWGVGR
jgi:hypothetical protein